MRILCGCVVACSVLLSSFLGSAAWSQSGTSEPPGLDEIIAAANSYGLRRSGRTAGSRMQLIFSCNSLTLTAPESRLKIRLESCQRFGKNQTRLFSRGSLGMEKQRKRAFG